MSIIVEAVGTIVAQKNGTDTKKLEAAMVRGIARAQSAGVSLSDREGIRRYQQEELEKVKSGTV